MPAGGVLERGAGRREERRGAAHLIDAVKIIFPGVPFALMTLYPISISQASSHPHPLAHPI